MLCLFCVRAAAGQQPAPAETALCTSAFTDAKRPAYLSGATKRCLDQIALTLQENPGARLFLVGHCKAGERATTAAQRAANAEAYLVTGKGIPSSRISARYGGRIHESTVTAYLVADGAQFTGEPGTAAVPSSMMASADPPGYSAAQSCAP